MTDLLTRFDSWLADDGPAALVLKEALTPVEGKHGVLFPPTFAAGEDRTFKGGYNINPFPDGTNVCLVDSVGSQANRIEPLFLHAPYSNLVPQVVVKAGEMRVNLLEAGHRAGDAIIRNSEMKTELHDAFKAVLRGDAEPLARLAPTSLVFGVWDSRDTQAKLPRLLASTIRAYNVRPLTRSATFMPAISYSDEGVLPEPTDKKGKDAYSRQGFTHVPASWSHGGIIADGGVRREGTLHLGALRLLFAGDDASTTALRRYILGLALTAFTMQPASYLRQGCNLVRDPEEGMTLSLVFPDGRREPPVPDAASNHIHSLALEYAAAAAEAFKVGEDREVDFDRAAAKKELDREKKAK